MADPTGYVNFADFLGLNDEAGQEMLKRTTERGGALRDEVYAANENRDNLARGGAEAFASGGERVRQGLASYGKFMASLRDPAKRQALMEEVYGKGAVSVLDTALMGNSSRTADAIASGEADLKEAQRYSKLRGERGAVNAANADAYRKQDEEYDAMIEAKRKAHKEMLAKRDIDDENARVDDWVRRSGDAGSAFGNEFDPRKYDPNAMVSNGSSSGWDLFSNPLGNKMNPSINAREKARGAMKMWELGNNSYAARKWVKGASDGGGGYDDSAIAAEQKRRWGAK